MAEFVTSDPLSGQRFVAGRQASAATLDLMLKMIRGMKGRGGIIVKLRSDGIEISGGGEGVGTWSGWYWFGGVRRYWMQGTEGRTPENWATDFDARFLRIHLTDGTAEAYDDVADDDIPTAEDDDLDDWEYFQVKTRTNTGTEESPVYVYTPSGHTVGDIRCRIT